MATHMGDDQAAARVTPRAGSSKVGNESDLQEHSLVCNLCGEPAYTVVFEAGVAQISRIVRCDACGLMYANPRARPVDIDLIKEFDPDWEFEHYSQTNYRWRVEKESLQTRDYRSTRRFLAERFPARGTLLEVGCGMGHLLDFFRDDGWDSVGVEPNAGLCRCAQRDFHLKVIAGTLEEVKLPSEYADVVTMMHVIEHVPDPLSTFREVFRILKPGGVFVVETPRYDGLMFKLLGKRERSLSCEGHIYFFTTVTLPKMARKAGFGVLRTDLVGRSMTGERLLYNLGVVSKSKAVQNALSGISTGLRLNRLAVTLNLRDMQRVYLQKPSDALQSQS
jgi:SAM-dependent methyltransferase